MDKRIPTQMKLVLDLQLLLMSIYSSTTRLLYDDIIASSANYSGATFTFKLTYFQVGELAINPGCTV